MCNIDLKSETQKKLGGGGRNFQYTFLTKAIVLQLKNFYLSVAKSRMHIPAIKLTTKI